MSVRKIIPILCLSLLLLAACGPTATPMRPPTSVPRTEVVPTASPDPFARPEMTVQGQLADGTPFGVTAEGHYFQGNPQAPVLLYEFSDFQ
jgi:hypothetical protein